MGDGTQEFHGVFLGLQGIVAGGRAFHGDGPGLNFKGLLCIWGQNQCTPDNQGSADVDFGNFLKICNGIIVNHLNWGEISTVIQNDEAELLGGALVADPAADLDFLTGIFFRVTEQFTNGD